MVLFFCVDRSAFIGVHRRPIKLFRVQDSGFLYQYICVYLYLRLNRIGSSRRAQRLGGSVFLFLGALAVLALRSHPHPPAIKKKEHSLPERVGARIRVSFCDDAAAALRFVTIYPEPGRPS
jgi:hypothetical protein